MIKYILSFGLTFFMLSSVCIFAQEEMDSHSLEAMTKLANPNENHDYLKQMAGNWAVEWSHIYDPDLDPLTGKGESKNEMVLGGRFLQLSGTTQFMKEKKGILQFIGYDNRLEYYFLIGMDEFGTYAIFAEGEYIKEENQWVFVGVDLDPTGTEDFPFRIELTMLGKDTFTMDSYFGEDDEEIKAMSVKYTRKK